MHATRGTTWLISIDLPGISLVAQFVTGRTMSLFQFMNFNWFQSKSLN